MSDSKIPQRVKDFIARHIGSVAHLEVLLLMRRRRDERLTAEAVNLELRTSIQSAQEKLQDLCDGQLLAREDGATPAYQYRPPAGSADDVVVAQLANAYQERRFTVIDLIFAKPLKNVQTFADAFRLRQDEEDESDA